MLYLNKKRTSNHPAGLVLKMDFNDSLVEEVGGFVQSGASYHVFEDYTGPDGSGGRCIKFLGNLNQRLSLTDQVGAFDFGTGDFCVDVFVNDIGGVVSLNLGPAGGGGDNLTNAITYYQSNLYMASGAAAYDIKNSGPFGGYGRLTVSREGQTLRMFRNGTVVSTSSPVTKPLAVTGQLRLGWRRLSAIQPGIVQMKNLRIWRGTPRFTENFDPAIYL